jgi:predicted phage-related endonuclease
MSEPVREVREITSIADWLTWRQSDVTASRVACLFDAHPYMTRDNLAEVLRGTTGSGGSTNPPDNAAMRRGRIWEPACAAAIAEERPEWRLTKATAYHRLPALRLGCTPDYFVDDDGLVQIKTCSPRAWEAWHGRPPLAYTIQTLTELLVTGRAWGCLAVMVMSQSYPVHYFAVPRHPAAEARILNAVAEWWRAWDGGEIAHAAPSTEIAADLDDGSFVDLSKDNALPAMLDERAALKATTSDAERRLKELDYEIKNRMGRASRGWLPGWNISFATQHRKEVLLPARDIRVLRVRATKEQEATDDAAE